jgi:hypothetical protein
VFITRIDEKTIAISQLETFHVELLRKVPSEADPGESDAARARIFSAPADDTERELNESWEKYVKPELQSIFRTANETVAADLMQFDRDKSAKLVSYNLRIPVKHIDCWLNSLNQARLAIAARNGFTDRDINGGSNPAIISDRDLALFQIHFYGFLQEIFIREIEGA